MKENIKEDIKRISILIDYIENADYVDASQCFDAEDIQAIDHIISDYKRVLKENEELKEKNGSLELEEKRRIIGKYGDTEIHKVINKVLADDYILKQKIKDKIEELEKWIYTGENAPQDFLQYRVKAKIQALQGLLESED